MTKNKTTVNLTLSWLRACDIDACPGNESDIIVNDISGNPLRVFIASQNEPEPKDAVTVLQENLSHRNKAVYLPEFHKLTEAAGFGKPIPIDRGDSPTKKLNYNDDVELVMMRHCEFRKAVNPPKEAFDKYKNVIDTACWSFLKSNYELCQKNMLDREDLVTYAMIWTTNFCTHYEVVNPVNNENEKKLYTHIMQRFYEFRRVLIRKGRNTFPCYEDSLLGLFGYAPDSVIVRHSNGKYDIRDVEKAQSRSSQKSYKEKSANKQEAKALLDELLSNMGHDKMVETFNDLIYNRKIHPDAKKEANKRLKNHIKKCNVCRFTTDRDE